MNQTRWEDFIDEVIKICSPSAYQEFIHDGEEDAEEFSSLTASIYHGGPLLLLTVGIYQEVMGGTDLSVIAAGLDRLWETAIHDRDTSKLKTAAAEDEDEEFVDELESLRDEADGLMAIFEVYVAGEPKSDLDANALIQQADLLTSSNRHKARQVFGQAGAAILQGAPYWPLWHLELDAEPAAGWVRGLWSIVSVIKLDNIYPLVPFPEQREKFKEQRRPPAPPGELSAEDESEEKLSPEEEHLMDILFSGEEDLTEEQIAAISFTPDIVERLGMVVGDEGYYAEDSEGQGWAPIHAATLLGESGSVEAIAPLLFALYKCDVDDILFSTIINALSDLGSLALPLVLDSMQYSTDPKFKLALADVLGKIGRGDERAFRALEAFYHETTWDDDRISAVIGLAELGDPRALPLLHRALNDRDIDSMGINEVLGALEQLDPALNKAELKRLETKARQRYDSRTVKFDKYGQAFCRDCGSLMRKGPFGEWVHVEPESRAEPAPLRGRSAPPVLQTIPRAIDPRFKNVGRNDPCPCGSGKKFKHCHGAGRTVN
jgi:hypothetical protein